MRDQVDVPLRHVEQTVFEIDQALVGVQLVLPDIIQVGGDVLQRHLLPMIFAAGIIPFC